MVTTVVIGLEPSGSARQACLSGIELANQLDARIHLVTAFSDGAPCTVTVVDSTT